MSSSPVSAIDAAATPELDGVVKLPAANSRSFSAMIAVQALNAFNDNFVKILLIAFAGVVAKGTDLGTSMQLYLGAIFSLPYIIFAPVAGWLSDRFSKQQVIFWMQVVQVIIFGFFLATLLLKQAQLSLLLSLGCFFLLATQAAFFSPAKMGIAKELVGSRRLGSASGILQLTNFMGILGGMGVAGYWFSLRLKSGLDPWDAVWHPMVVVTIVAIVQIFGSLLIMRTPEHRDVKFHKGVWIEHFGHMKLLISQRPLLLAAIGVTYFWFMSYTVGAILVTLSHDLHPNDPAAATQAMSMMPAMLGIGVMAGSLLASAICRRRLELGLVPLSGFGLALTLLWSGLAPVSPWIYMALVGVGLAGGAFMTPLYAFVQDRARPDERARILSAMNLMDSIGGVVANMVLVKLMIHFGVPSAWQILVLVPLSIAAAIFITKLLPRSLLMIIGRAIVVAMYRLKSHHEERTPDKGSLLLLPNHTSYTDALMIGATCERKVRFVILESLYEIKAIQWALKVFGTVPISPVRAKDAIRTVADALKAEQAVVLFPEGQLTRNGYLNQINKGYELMARMGGDVKVQPVWIDGLWGSVFSFDQGRFFTKRPRTFRYAVSTWYGHPLPAREATVERMRQELLALAAEAFAARAVVQKRPGYTTPEGRKLTEQEARVTQLNTLRVLHTALIWKDDSLLCLLPASHPLHATFTTGLPDHQDVTVFTRAQDVKVQEGKKLVVIGDTAGLTGFTPPAGAFVVHALETADFPAGVNTLPEVPKALYDASTGALLTLSIPHPEMPAGEEGLQVGHKTGSAGHFLPSLAMRTEGGDLVFGAILPGNATETRVVLPGAKLDEMGFVFPGA